MENVPDLSSRFLHFWESHFGHDMVVLHEHEMCNAQGVFSMLVKCGRREWHFDDVHHLAEGAPFVIIAANVNASLQ